MQPQGFGVTLLTDQRYESGYVDSGRTGALTGCSDQPGAYAGLTVFVADVFCIFLPEVADCRENRVRGGLPQPAEGGVFNLLAQFDQAFNIAFLTVTFGDTGENFEHPFGSDAAGSTLSAGLFLHEFEKVAGYVDHTGVVVHYNQSAGAHDGTEFAQRIVIQRNI